LWRRAALPRLDLMRATYVTQTFPLHAHEGFALGVVEAGALGFRYRGAEVVAPAGAVNLANPGEPHTGQAAVPEGWRFAIRAAPMRSHCVYFVMFRPALPRRPRSCLAAA